MYCIVLYCITLYCIGLCCIVLYCIVLYCIVVYCNCIALYCIVLYCMVLHCIALHCIALDWIGLDWIVLYCIALHCIALHHIASHRIASHRIASDRILIYCIVLYCIVLYCIVLMWCNVNMNSSHIHPRNAHGCRRMEHQKPTVDTLWLLWFSLKCDALPIPLLFASTERCVYNHGFKYGLLDVVIVHRFLLLAFHQLMIGRSLPFGLSLVYERELICGGWVESECFRCVSFGLCALLRTAYFCSLNCLWSYVRILNKSRVLEDVPSK